MNEEGFYQEKEFWEESQKQWDKTQGPKKDRTQKLSFNDWFFEWLDNNPFEEKK